LIAVTRPDGQQTLAAYTDRLSLPVTVTEPGGATWQQTYGPSGERLSLTDPLGATTRYTYDELGHLASITNALGDETLIRCNPAGLPVEVTEPGGAVTRYGYDAFGRLTSTADPLGHTTRTTWTVEGRPASRTAPDGHTETWTYDGEGNCLTHTDRLGRTTTYEYTHFETLTARTTPDGARHEYVYDADMRLVAVLDALRRQWTYRYDEAGRLVEERDFDQRVVRYEFDAAAQVVARTNPLGQVLRFAYDVLGQTVRQDADGRVTEYTYDLAGNLVRAVGPDADVVRTVDARGNVLTDTVNGRTVGNAYDPLGRRIRRTTPSGHVSEWQYDRSGRTAALAVPGGTLDFTYDLAGREQRRAIGGIAVHSDWDPNRRLTAQSVRTGERELQRRSHAYRPDGNLLVVDDQLAGARSYGLDPVGRVTAATGVDWAEHYAYGPAGDLVHADWPAAGASSAARGERGYSGTTLTTAGRVRYEYDAAGRTVLRQVTRLSRKPDTWHYTWDAEDRLTGVTTPDGAEWHYRYDPLGRRTVKQRLENDAVVERTDFDWDGATLAEQTTHAPYLPGPHTISWDHAGHRPLAQSETITVQDTVDRRFFAIVTDLVGTPTELIDPAAATIAWRAVSTVWGTTTWPGDSSTYTPLRFPGQYFDPETRLHYNLHRYYDPETARYTSPDPLGLAPAPNPVAYVVNPHTWCDPLGLSPHPPEGDAERYPGVGTIVHDRGVHIQIYSNDHAPAHAHVKGGGAEVRIGQNGKPLAGDPELSPKQQKVVDEHLQTIRRNIAASMERHRK
ncbi:RHS repeat-associated core domain-containing protein, partial [Kitasatospora sp. NPDC049285]|uniref:RHS repeat-associated core domain-containing protein n=1 Tax=Kitasatospora sp. NPDC049285 TaxID=3157096 RepID=UPI0034374A52